MQRVLYHEEQRKLPVWFRLVMLLVALPFWILFVQQALPGYPFGEKPAPDAALWILWLLFGIGLPVTIFSIKLVVWIDDQALHVKLVPFTTRRIPLQQIVRLEVKSFHPLFDYGGYGGRWLPGWGWAFVMDGNRGVLLDLADGKKLMIGSQTPEKLYDTIQQTRVTK
jgi:hypothetical protein